LEDRKDFFKSDKGFLWKCQWGSNLKDLNDDLFKVDDNSSNERAYELKTGKKHFDKAKEQIRDFITKLNTLPDAKFPSWISSVCDVDFLLKTYAMLVAVGHWDDYWNDMNNYYIFFNSRDKSSYKFFMIPYDLDNTLGTSHNCGVQTDSGRHDPYNWGMDQCPLIKRILQVPEYKAVYTEYLKDFTDLQGPLFGWKASQTRINSWINLIQPYVPNDTGEDMEIKDRPASWGNHPEYRILSYGKNNWFKVKTESIAEWISKQ
jgi:spore coat protein CotH